MPMTESRIEQLAESILAAHEVYRIPVDPLALARREGIRLLPGNYDGCFDARIEHRARAGAGRFYLFYVQATDERPIERVRFSLAHELGHYFLPEHRRFLLRSDQHGHPLDVTARNTRDPAVVDLSALAAVPSLQRFVVATIFRQLVDERTGSAAQRGLIYLVTLDELNRFAPRGSHDPITELIERVAGEMRSQGIILLGAQQQASLVSARVIENAGLKALGKSGSQELGQEVWRFLSDAARRKAANLLPEEKLLIQDGFREPMLVKVPFPPWALRGEDAVDEHQSVQTAELDPP